MIAQCTTLSKARSKGSTDRADAAVESSPHAESITQAGILSQLVGIEQRRSTIANDKRHIYEEEANLVEAERVQRDASQVGVASSRSFATAIQSKREPAPDPAA